MEYGGAELGGGITWLGHELCFAERVLKSLL